MAFISCRLYFITGHWPVVKDMRLRPSQADADAELAALGVLVDAAGIVGHVETRNAEAPPARTNCHYRVQHGRGRSTRGIVAMAAGFEAHAIHRAIDFRHAQDLLDLLAQRGVLAQIHSFAAEALGLREPLGNHVADDDDRRAQQMSRRRAGQADRPAPAT